MQRVLGAWSVSRAFHHARLEIIELYSFSDTVEALKELQARGHVDVLVFSNGMPSV